MKKILILSMLFFSFNSFAYKQVVASCLLGYLIPSVAQMNGADIVGTAICSSAAGYYLFDQSRNDQESLKKEVDAFIKDSKEDIKNNFETSQKNYGYYQEIIRDTVEQKFGEFDEEIKKGIRDHLESKEFKSLIKQKIIDMNSIEKRKHLDVLNDIEKNIEKKVDLKLRDLGVTNNAANIETSLP